MIFWTILRRVIVLGAVLVGHALAHVFGRRLSRWPTWLGFLPPPRLTPPERLRMVLEDLGGTFIKLGQMLALQPDVLSFAYCNALFDLLDRVPSFGFKQVECVFLEEVGQRPSDIFETFSEQPMASASIGQVHTASLDGRRLVVKVQRPEVKTDFMGDIYVMTTAVRLIQRLHLTSLSWMIEPISEFVAWTREELDYRREARYMDQLRRNARHNPCERIPQVFWQYTTRRLLVMEFLEGVTVLDYIRSLEAGDQGLRGRLNTMGFHPDQFARNIIDNFLGDVFQHGMFHADLHPANLLILPGNIVGYVDFGITGVLSHYSRKELVSLTLAYTRADFDGMCVSFAKVSSMDEDSDLTGFRRGLQRYADEWYEAQGGRQHLRKNFTLVMLDMLKLSRETNIWPERDVIKYIRSAIAIDGLITRFAPGFDVGAYLESTCIQYLKQARQSVFSSETLIDWLVSSSHLIHESADRMIGLLDRLSSLEETSRRADHGDIERQQVTHLGLIVLAVSLLMSATGEPVQLGFNVFTVEMVLLIVSAILLAQTLYRLR